MGIRNLLAPFAFDYHYQIASNWVLNFGGDIGHIQDFGEDIKINDIFFLGGDNLRGFEVSGVGPGFSDRRLLGGRTL